MKIKTIDVTALEWFDRINGNSYFSARVTLNYGMKTEKTVYLPFQYGYGDHYQDCAARALSDQGLIEIDDRTALWAWCKDHGAIYRYSKTDALKRDVKAFGRGPANV